MFYTRPIIVTSINMREAQNCDMRNITSTLLLSSFRFPKL